MRQMWLAATLVVAVMGCPESKESASNDGGASTDNGDAGPPSSSPSDDGGTPSDGTDAPPIPTANEGEFVVTVRDQGVDKTYECMSGSTFDPQFSHVGEFYGVFVSCNAWSGSGGVNVELGVNRVAPFAAGDYDISVPGKSLEENESNVLKMVVTEDAQNGFTGMFGAAGNAGEQFSEMGTLTLEDTGETSGNTRGHYTVTWTRVQPFVDGVAQAPVDRPGGLSVAFNTPYRAQ